MLTVSEWAYQGLFHVFVNGGSGLYVASNSLILEWTFFVIALMPSQLAVGFREEPRFVSSVSGGFNCQWD